MLKRARHSTLDRKGKALTREETKAIPLPNFPLILIPQTRHPIKVEPRTNRGGGLATEKEEQGAGRTHVDIVIEAVENPKEIVLTNFPAKEVIARPIKDINPIDPPPPLLKSAV